MRGEPFGACGPPLGETVDVADSGDETAPIGPSDLKHDTPIEDLRGLLLARRTLATIPVAPLLQSAVPDRMLASCEGVEDG